MMIIGIATIVPFLKLRSFYVTKAVRHEKTSDFCRQRVRVVPLLELIKVVPDPPHELARRHARPKHKHLL